MRCFVMSAAVLLAAVAVAPAADETVDNPAFQTWSKFKPGATVVLKRVVKNTSPDNPNVIDVTAHPPVESEEWITYKLLAASKESVTVERSVKEVEGGNLVEYPGTKITYPAKIAKKHIAATTPKDKLEEFEEVEATVKVAGRTIKTQVYKSVIKIGGELSIAKVWTSDEIPGGIVKDVVIKKQGDKAMYESVTELAEFHPTGDGHGHAH
jgi:hypothetical protein